MLSSNKYNAKYIVFIVYFALPARSQRPLEGKIINNALIIVIDQDFDLIALCFEI